MTARGYVCGHAIEWRDGAWRYADTGEPTLGARVRPCGACGRFATPEGHDPCLGTLPGVANACCGHGRDDEAYVQLKGGYVERGATAIQTMNVLKNIRRLLKKAERTRVG